MRGGCLEFKSYLEHQFKGFHCGLGLTRSIKTDSQHLEKVARMPFSLYSLLCKPFLYMNKQLCNYKKTNKKNKGNNAEKICYEIFILLLICMLLL